jgi:hypothetical protein
MAQDWDIKPLGASCQACDRAFQDGAPYRSTLVFGEEGYRRADFCEACWTQDRNPADAVSTWQGVYRAPAPPPEEALKKETAESLLRRLMKTDDASRVNVIYILGVMLERKRILVERDVQIRDNGIKILVYEHRKTGETFLVPDPQLRLDELEHVQEEVVTMLGGKAPGQAQEEESDVSDTAPDPPQAD